MSPVARLLSVFGVASLVGLLGSSVLHAQGQYTSPWRGCCGVRPWPNAQGWGGPGMMGQGFGGGMMGGSMARNHTAMMGGLPKAYAQLRNPLPVTRATLERG